MCPLSKCVPYPNVSLTNPNVTLTQMCPLPKCVPYPNVSLNPICVRLSKCAPYPYVSLIQMRPLTQICPLSKRVPYPIYVSLIQMCH